MQKQYSISQAQRRFAAIVQETETDGPIQITQRGKPIAVLLSPAAYEQLVSNRPQEPEPEPTQFDFYSDLTLIINAGGQSRRMGVSKALLPVPPNNTPLIAHVAARLAALQPARLVVVTNDPHLPAQAQLPPDTHFVPDAYPDTGTLGGIATGLQHARGWAVVIACDLPLVSAPLFGMLVDLAGEQEGGADRWDAVVPVVDGYEEPLHALYHRRCLPAIEARLAAGQRRAISFLPDVRPRYVQEDALRAVDTALRSFLNTNTPEEWAAATRLLDGE